ncbi:MAG: winged helix-turn-helix domain-containing protein [Flavonifractor plautii]
MHFLASHPGQVFTREQLYTRIWRCDSDFNVDEAVRSHIKFLRRKLASSGKEYIQTVWGIGYRFAP